MRAVVALLEVFGLNANGVLIHLAVRFSGRAALLGSALSVAVFNLGTVVIALSLVPTTLLALIARRRARMGADVTRRRSHEKGEDGPR